MNVIRCGLAPRIGGGHGLQGSRGQQQSRRARRVGSGTCRRCCHSACVRAHPNHCAAMAPLSARRELDELTFFDTAPKPEWAKEKAPAFGRLDFLGRAGGWVGACGRARVPRAACCVCTQGPRFGAVGACGRSAAAQRWQHCAAACCPHHASAAECCA
jgi:hypothetical protein